MKTNRREFFQTVGTSAAGLAMGAATMNTACSQAAKDKDGQMLLIGDNVAVTDTGYGKVRRYFRAKPVYASAETQTLDGCTPCNLVGQHGASEHGEPLC
jgi:hypothetical protein